MENTLQIAIVCIALAISLFIWVSALFKGQSYRRNYFLLLQATVILSLFGYLLQISSTNAEEAFAGVKVLYTGTYFTALFTFFFIANYCSVTLHKLLIKTPLFLISLVIVAIMWTTRDHGLMYMDYYLVRGAFQYLSFTPGPVYLVSHFFPSICILMALGIILHRIKIWSKKFRIQLYIFSLCMIVPFFFEILYYISVHSMPEAQRFYYTPYSMAIMSIFLYLGIMHFNIFEIINTATTTAMEHVKEGFILVDDDYNFLFSNPAAEKIFPGIATAPKGEPIDSIPNWPSELNDIENDFVEFPIENGETRYYRASMSPVFAKNNVRAKIFLFRDITDTVNLMKDLENAAYIDSLTGIYNRKHFTELAVVDINRALRQNQTIYTAMLDLDFFKKVNDTYGHAAGDAVLKKTADIIHNTIRSYDLVGRYGGEEFVLLFTGLDAQEAVKLMERIREIMENTITYYEDIEIIVTCSIGLAKFSEGDTLDSSIKKSDEALYAAKNGGRNLVIMH